MRYFSKRFLMSAVGKWKYVVLLPFFFAKLQRKHNICLEQLKNIKLLFC